MHPRVEAAFNAWRKAITLKDLAFVMWSNKNAAAEEAEAFLCREINAVEAEKIVPPVVE